MKKILSQRGLELRKIIFLSILGLLLISVTSVNARELSAEEYSKLHLLFSDPKISILTDDEIDYYLSYDFSKISSTNKYYKVTETPYGHVTTEVSKEEAILASNNAKKTPNTRGTYYSTSYKSINISKFELYNDAFEIYLYTQWYITPNVKSFDVTGIRVHNGYVIDGTQYGTQTYATSNSNYNHINYLWNGTNIKKTTNGFGISMNLVDSGVYFSADVTANVQKSSSQAEVYGAYEHAIENVTLAQSHDYYINSSGFGHVFNFSEDIINSYDGMHGVSIDL